MRVLIGEPRPGRPGLRTAGIQNCGAYLTVEAAMVMPLAMGVIVFIIYIMLYQYDRCILEQDIGTLALRGGRNWQEDAQTAADGLRTQADSLYTDKYVVFSGKNIDITFKHGKVTVKGSGSLKTVFSGRWFPGGNWRLSAVFENDRLSPTTVIRAIRKLHKIGT